MRVGARRRRRARAGARARRPTLVLTDVVMPRMDGYTLCRTLKADPALHDTPVILLTSLTSPQDVIEGLACGADNFVRKPYESASLLARVERCLADGAERGRVPGRPPPVGAEREQVLEFLFSTFEETVHLDGELTRSYHSLDLLYRLAEGLNRCATEREVVLEALARALELPGVRGAWIEIEGERLAGSAGTCARMRSLAQAPPVDFTVELRTGAGVARPSCSSSAPTSALLDDDELRTLDALRQPGRRGARARAAAGAPRAPRAGAHRRAVGRDRGAPARGGGAAGDGGDRRVRRRRHGPARPRRADRDLEPRRRAPVRLRRRRGGRQLDRARRPPRPGRRAARDAQPRRLGRVDPGLRDGAPDPRRHARSRSA